MEILQRGGAVTSTRRNEGIEIDLGAQEVDEREEARGGRLGEHGGRRDGPDLCDLCQG